MKFPDITNVDGIAEFFRKYGLWILIGIVIMIIYAVIQK